jgi:hypothetical protein
MRIHPAISSPYIHDPLALITILIQQGIPVPKRGTGILKKLTRNTIMTRYPSTVRCE